MMPPTTASRQPRIPSMLSLTGGTGGIGGGLPSSCAVRRQSCVANLPSPSVHVPSISARLNTGFGPSRTEGMGRYGNRVVAMQQNGGSGVRHCELEADVCDVLAPSVDNLNGAANEVRNNDDGDRDGVKTTLKAAGPLGLVKRICSDGVLSMTSFGSGSSEGASENYWMLMITPVVSSFSVALVIAAVAGPQWLFTEEKLSNRGYNGTMNYNVKDDGIYLTKYTKASLWTLCSKMGGATLGQTEFQCTNIDYFPQEDYNPDPLDSTNAIPYTVTHSSPFFLVSNVVLVISYVLFLLAMCSSGHKICYFVSGVLFIISGLLMLIGLIMFISILKAEIGYKLRPRSSLQAPLFTFRYGQSFLLYVFGFIITELSGIFNVLIYSNLHQAQLNRSQIYPTYQNLSANYYSMTPTMDSAKPLSNSVDYGMSNGARPRFYIENIDDCAVHRYHRDRKNLVKSLNELYTEPAPEMRSTATATSPPAAVDISATSQIEIAVDSGKLTRSISTTTDILLMDDPKSENDKSEENLKNICGISKQYLTRELSKEKLFNEFCKKVGPRPKPKNIYYIEDNAKDRDDSQNVFVIEGNNSDDDKFKRRRSNSMMVGAGSVDALERRQRIRSDNSLDQMYVGEGLHDGYPRLNYDMRQTLPRNFMKKHHSTAQHTIVDDRGGFNSLDDLVDHNGSWNRRISASGILEPVKWNSSQNNLDTSSPYHHGSKWPKIIPKSTNDFTTLQQQYLHHPQSPSYVEYSVKSPATQGHHSIGDLSSYQPQQPPAQYATIQHSIVPPPFNYMTPATAPPAVFSGKFSPIFDLDKIERERRKSHSQLFLNQAQYDYVNGTAV
ncbi:uncharacterized protein LOC134227705 [Armigeres subalbatus]|uniref:uncharacterized protein LOC134227705 n=1 Tax=Armigeres subalbatus TaxID=124917 RepID=UPI002ED0AE74